MLAAPASFESLVLMCSGPAGIGGNRRAVIEQLEPVLAASGLAAVYAASQAIAAAQPGYVAPHAALAEFLQTAVPRRRAGDAAGHGHGAARRAGPRRRTRATGVRTLVLYGVDDDAWPTAVQDEMAARLGAATVAVPAAAHSPAVENPSATAAALLDFWHAGRRD